MEQYAMSIFWILMALLGVLLVVALIRAYRHAGRQNEALTVLFVPGSRVAHGEKRYEVVGLDLGLVSLRALDDGRIRLLDLMTGAGTFRTEMLETWKRV